MVSENEVGREIGSSADPAFVPASPHSAPFWGRSALLAEARGALEPDGASAIMVGAAGSGKTRLAREATLGFLEARPNTRIARFAATTATQRTPLAVFAPALRALRGPAGDSPEEVARSLVRACTGGAKGIPLIVLIDDTPQLDPMSEAVTDLLLALPDVRVLLTCRSVPGPSALLARAWRDGELRRIEVPELTQPETAEFSAAMLPGKPFAPDTIHRLHQSTGGNPLFLAELIGALDRSGAFEDRHGLRVWPGSLPPGTSLHDVLRAEIARLPADERTAFETTALCSPAPLHLLDDSISPDALERLLEKEVVRIVYRTDGRPVLELAHPIYGETAETMLNRVRIRQQYRELYDRAVEPLIAEDLERTTGGGTIPTEDLLTVVDWGLHGDREVPLELLEPAFRFARPLVDHGFRVRIASALLRRPGLDPSLRIAALVNRLEAFRYLGDPEAVAADEAAARALIETMPASAERTGLAADLAIAFADAAVLMVGRWEDAVAALDWADRLGAAGPPAAATTAGIRVEAQRGIALCYGGEMVAATELERRLSEATQGTPGFLPFAPTSILLHGQRGETRQARQIARQQLRFAVQVAADYPLAAGEIIGVWCLVDVFAGHSREAAFIYGVMEQAIARGAGGPRLRETVVSSGRGLLALMQGDWTRASECLAIACSELDDFTGTGSEGLLLASLALAQTASGDLAGARVTRASIAGWTTGTSRLLDVPSRYHLLLARLWAPDGTERGEAEAIAQRAREYGFGLMELRALHAIQLCGGPQLPPEQLARARELGSSLAAPIAPLLAQHIDQLRAPGRENAGDTARRLARRGMFVPTPRHPALTVREQHVAELVSLGYSNAQIAKRLQNSRRTVETHVARILMKLGAGSREAVAEALDATRWDDEEAAG